VYVPLAWLLTTDGFHTPVSPLSEVPGNVGTVPPAQIVRLLPKLNTGKMFGFTVTVNVTGPVTHWPAAAVNVYTPEFWLSTDAGLHAPVIPFCEVVGSDGTVPPPQMVRLGPKLNVGVIFRFTVTANDAVVAHWPGSGVNV